MTDRSLESEISDHYNAAHLPEDRIAVLLEASDFAVTATRWRRLAIAASMGMAAMALLALGLYMNRTAIDESSIAVANGMTTTQSTNNRNPAPNLPVIVQRDDQIVETPQYRLVAFRSHSDGCPHCRATGEVYAELNQSSLNEVIAFEQFDLSRDRERQQTIQRIDELHLTSLIEGRIETAFLALVDNQGQSIREFKPSMNVDKIAEMILDTTALNRPTP